MIDTRRRAPFHSLVGLLTIVVVGCANSEHHSVSWYEEHKEDLDAKVAWCADDKARQSDIDCQNAVQAKSLTSVGDWNTRRQAPVSFGAPASAASSSAPQ
jgi:hypothetical protein